MITGKALWGLFCRFSIICVFISGAFSVSSFAAGPITARVFTRDGHRFEVEHFSVFLNDGRGGNINRDGCVRVTYQGAMIILPLKDIQSITLLGDRRVRLVKNNGQILDCEEAAIGWLYGRAEGGKFEMEALKASKIEIIPAYPVVGKSCPACGNRFSQPNYRFCPYCGKELQPEK